jgi:hypothetical protein
MKAFSRKGIPTAFFDGNTESLPPAAGRLSGVRLAVLDMDLIGGHTDEKSKASAAASYLAGIIAPDNGPYGVLAWTNHPDVVELFEKYVFVQSEVQNPIFTVTLEKALCKKSKRKFDLSLVSQKLEEKLTEMSPLCLLQAWEHKCFKAASSVTVTLSQFAGNNESSLKGWRSTWRDQLLRLIYDMAKAEAEDQLDANTCLPSMYSLLNPLHADQMESEVADLSRTLSGHASEIMGVSGGCGDEAEAKVNTMLHLSLNNADRFAAGSIFKFSPSEKVPAWVPSIDGLLSDLAHREYQSGARADELKKVCHLALIEVTPACDHAQSNIRVARLIGGLLVPKAERNKFKMKREESFVWELGPLFLNDGVPQGIYWLLFSARHLVSRDLEKARKKKIYARLRSQAFGDLQAWFARHSARSGMTVLHKSGKKETKDKK